MVGELALSHQVGELYVQSDANQTESWSDSQNSAGVLSAAVLGRVLQADSQLVLIRQ